MCESKKGMSANQMKRTLGVSYKTAWYLCHRIRAAMTVINPRPLTGVVEADETGIGGVKKGTPRGKWRDTKTMVLGVVERGGEIRLRIDKRASKKIIHTFLEETTEEIEALYTDEHGAYQGFTENHSSVVHRSDEWVRGQVHANAVEGVWSLFKRSIVGSYHQLSAKHLDAYLDEFEWRFNNRDNAYLFTDTLRKLVTADVMEYKALTGR
jgi:transposase-like protein